jgi:prepilin-type N-terminal cleavage/methylation domain-containing protein/prepilin-type processing-associated H-X9-DG protein
MQRRVGFTLVELLVVVSIVALLVALMLPTLGHARQATRDVKCRSNLRQMQVGWLTYMQASKSLIPYTKQINKHPNWVDALDSVYPNAPNLWNTAVDYFNVCPTVQREHPRMFYTPGRWGYAVNTWWANGGGELNEWKSWQAIVHPDRYPWFTDPAVYAWGSGTNAAYCVPSKDRGPPGWGVGANHGAGTKANVAYADGSARAVAVEAINQQVVGPDDYGWFENR